MKHADVIPSPIHLDHSYYAHCNNNVTVIIEQLSIILLHICAYRSASHVKLYDAVELCNHNLEGYFIYAKRKHESLALLLIKSSLISNTSQAINLVTNE